VVYGKAVIGFGQLYRRSLEYGNCSLQSRNVTSNRDAKDWKYLPRQSYYKRNAPASRGSKAGNEPSGIKEVKWISLQRVRVGGIVARGRIGRKKGTLGELRPTKESSCHDKKLWSPPHLTPRGQGGSEMKPRKPDATANDHFLGPDREKSIVALY